MQNDIATAGGRDCQSVNMSGSEIFASSLTSLRIVFVCLSSTGYRWSRICILIVNSRRDRERGGGGGGGRERDRERERERERGRIRLLSVVHLLIDLSPQCKRQRAEVSDCASPVSVKELTCSRG